MFISWLLAITLTPLFCYLGFKGEPESEGQEASEAGALGFYARLMGRALHWRWAVLGGAVVLFVVSLWSFQFAKRSFFPNSTTPQLVVDFWLPEGTDIDRTAATAKLVERYLLEQSRVRPVMMGTLTTVLGVMPLFFDAFFQSMAVVLVFGLGFATLLTLIVVPTLYASFFRIHTPLPAAVDDDETT